VELNAETDETSFPFCPWLQPPTRDAAEPSNSGAASGSKPESASPKRRRFGGSVNSSEEDEGARSETFPLPLVRRK